MVILIVVLIGLNLILIFKFLSLLYRLHIVFKLPGPKRTFILGNIPNLLCRQEKLFEKIYNWSRTFPIYVLTALHVYSIFIVNPNDIEILISGMKHSRKCGMYFVLKRWLRFGLLTSKGIKWQQRRKLLTPAFHFKMLQKYINIFQQETDDLVKKLIEIPEDRNVDVVPLLTEFALKSINETAMGVKLDFNKQIDLEYHKNILTFCSLAVKRICKPWLHNEFVYYNLSMDGRREKKAINELHNYTRNIIQKRISDKSVADESFLNIDNNNNKIDSCSNRKQLPMMDLLIKSQESNLIDLDGICEEVDTFLFEGHDTISVALCYTLMELANNEHFQDLILQEINKVLGESTDFPVKSLNELTFLEMCIKESLRLHPSVPIISRLTDEDIMTSTGYLIPRKSIVNVHIFAMHRNADIYPDPEKFDPYRFLPENAQKRHPFAFLPFSAGPRNCIGQKFAMLEMKIFLIGILRNFILKPVDKDGTVTYITDLILRTKNGIKVQFLKR